jgi:hypothetical protein
MAMGQALPVPFYCPRCGGPMFKPSGSSFYWHATSNHRPCSITNIAEVPKPLSVTNNPLELPKGKQRQKPS